MLSKQGEIRRDEACLDYAGTQIILYPCHGSKGNQFWEYNDEVIAFLIFTFGTIFLTPRMPDMFRCQIYV